MHFFSVAAGWCGLSVVLCGRKTVVLPELISVCSFDWTVTSAGCLYDLISAEWSNEGKPVWTDWKCHAVASPNSAPCPQWAESLFCDFWSKFNFFSSLTFIFCTIEVDGLHSDIPWVTLS